MAAWEKKGTFRMDDPISLQKLAEQTGRNKSTISRALNHCGGVDAQTAAEIRRLAKEQGYTTRQTGRAAPFCGVVLPENPAYYWGEAQRQLYAVLRDGKVPFRAALYPRLTDQEDFFSALETMMARSPKVLVVSAPAQPEVEQKLRDIAQRIPVFLLSERMEGINLVYFGSDPERDGALLGQTFREAYPDRKRLLILDSVQDGARTNAFLGECFGVQIAGRIHLPIWRPNDAAILARRIASDVKEPFDCVYCSTGSLPSACLALDKLKTSTEIVCIGYENPPGNARFIASGRIGLVLCQDITGQSKQCAQALVTLYRQRCFPEGKYHYIPSRILDASGER